jgi:hypothetical protein
MKDFMNVRLLEQKSTSPSSSSTKADMSSPGYRCTRTSSSAALPTASQTSPPSRSSPRRRAASCAASTSSSRALRDSASASRSRTLPWHRVVFPEGKYEIPEIEDEEREEECKVRRMIGRCIIELPGICMEFGLSRNLRGGKTRFYGPSPGLSWVGSNCRNYLVLLRVLTVSCTSHENAMLRWNFAPWSLLALSFSYDDR